MSAAPDLLEALLALGRWARTHSRSPLLLPPAGAPESLLAPVRRALRTPPMDATRSAALLAGAACAVRFLLEDGTGSPDWTSRILAADLEAAVRR